MPFSFGRFLPPLEISGSFFCEASPEPHVGTGGVLHAGGPGVRARSARLEDAQKGHLEHLRGPWPPEARVSAQVRAPSSTPSAPSSDQAPAAEWASSVRSPPGRRTTQCRSAQGATAPLSLVRAGSTAGHASRSLLGSASLLNP